MCQKLTSISNKCHFFQILVHINLLFLQLKSIRMLGMVHLVAVHSKHLPFVRDIRPGYCKTALLGLLVINIFEC